MILFHFCIICEVQYEANNTGSWYHSLPIGNTNSSRPRGRPKRTWTEVVQKDCQARNLNREDAMDRGT